MITQRELMVFRVLYAFMAIVVFLGLFVPVMEVDSAQYASISKQMWQSGNFLHLFNRDLYYLDKPPLLFWISSLSIGMLGSTDFAFKLPNALVSVLGVVSLFRFTRLYYSSRTAHYAALMYGFSTGFLLLNNDVRTDGLLIAFVIFSIYQLSKYRIYAKNLNFVLAFVGIAFAMMAKGPLGLIAVGMALVPDALLKRDYKFIFHGKWLLGVLILALLLFPMSYGLYTQFDAAPEVSVNGEQGVSGLKFFYWTQSFGRITGESTWAGAYSNNPATFYLVESFLWAFLPFTLVYILSFFQYIGHIFKSKFRLAANEEAISLSGVVLPLLALSQSGYQLNHYAYIVLPFAAVGGAAYLNRIIPQANTLGLLFRAQALILILVLCFVIFLQTFVFKEAAPMLVFFSLLLVVLALAFWLYQQFRFTALITLSSLVAAFVFVMFNVYYFPYLLRFQPEKQLFLDKQTLEIPDAQFYHYQPGTYHALDFYSKHYVPILQLWQLRSVADTAASDLYLSVSDAGMPDILSLGLAADTLQTYTYFPITELNPAFLNPESRNAQLQKRYLLKVPVNSTLQDSMPTAKPEHLKH